MRSSPATIAGSATPAACAAAAAPSAFDTLWRPASGSRTRADSSPIASVNTVTKAPASIRPAMASARTSALASMPKRRMRAPRGAIVRHDSANGSSALMTAVPPSSRAANISPSARATPARSPKPSRCSSPALVTSAMAGLASAASAAISPG